MKQLSQKAHAAAFHAEFFGYNTQKRYVLGINEFADAVADRVNLDGFIDEYTTATEYRSRPVVKLSDVPAGSMVISTVTRARPNTAMNKLLRLNGVVSMDYFAVADASHYQLPQVPALADTQAEYAAAPAKFEWVRELFADQESREVFNRVMEFRLNANLRAMRFFDYTDDHDYIEPFVKLKAGDVFVDCGAHNHNTARKLAKQCPQHGGVHTLNADEFLDNSVTESVGLIALDTGGTEPKALDGMKWHIQEDHPKLAVAVYHDPAHFWQVPEIILGIRSDYKVYLRHYTEGWTGTVMFFIPG